MESKPFLTFCGEFWDHLQSNLGIICGTGIICGPVQIDLAHKRSGNETKQIPEILRKRGSH